MAKKRRSARPKKRARVKKKAKRKVAAATKKRARAKKERKKTAARRKGKAKKKRRARGAGPARRGKPAPKLTGRARERKIAELREQLLERREVLLGGMEHSFESSPGSTRGDESDLAAQSLDGDTALQLAESGADEIAEIDEALGKMDDGTYGQCESCGGDIPWSRLEALPYATLCVQCKRMQELGRETEGPAAGWSAVDEMERMGQD
jgi:DnaK suppressor protein